MPNNFRQKQKINQGRRYIKKTARTEQWVEDDVARVYCHKDVLGQEAAKEELELSFEMVKKLKGKKLLLIDFAKLTKMDIVARKVFAKDPRTKEMFDKVVIICPNPVTRVIGAFFLGIDKPIYPLKIFGSPKEALKWLKE